jgi:hypothetical protein
LPAGDVTERTVTAAILLAKGIGTLRGGRYCRDHAGCRGLEPVMQALVKLDRALELLDAVINPGVVDRSLCPHRIRVPGSAVTAVRERIERRLGVETTIRPEADNFGAWAVYFDAPADVDLDFLRPDVLPPR